jgi:hypothetical protein
MARTMRGAVVQGTARSNAVAFLYRSTGRPSPPRRRSCTRRPRRCRPRTASSIALPIPSLQLIIQPAALDASYSPPVPLKTLPRGRYAIILMSFTGQTWRVPNELAPGVAEAAGLPVVPGQDFYIDLAL